MKSLKKDIRYSLFLYGFILIVIILMAEYSISSKSLELEINQEKKESEKEYRENLKRSVEETLETINLIYNSDKYSKDEKENWIIDLLEHKNKDSTNFSYLFLIDSAEDKFLIPVIRNYNEKLKFFLKEQTNKDFDKRFIRYEFNGKNEGVKQENYVVRIQDSDLYFGKAVVLDDFHIEFEKAKEDLIINHIFKSVLFMSINIIFILLIILIINIKFADFDYDLEKILKGIKNKNKNINDFKYEELFNLFSQINKIKELLTKEKQKIEDIKFIDYLTKLPNKSSFKIYLNELLEKKSKNYMIFFDIKNFKDINNALGHDMGDELLISVGELLKKEFGKYFIARHNNDEFLLIKEEAEEKEIKEAAETIKSMIEKNISHVSIRIGYLLVDKPYENLLSDATSLINFLKINNINVPYKFNDNICHENKKMFLLRNELKEAIKKDEIYLTAQPQYDGSKTIKGFEMLARWNHEGLGLIGPNIFIPIAEKHGLIEELGYSLISKASDFSYNINEGEKKYKVSINISGKQLENKNFISNMLNIFSNKKVNLNNILLEITESSLVNVNEDVIMNLEILRKMGISIAIDDFGTGYSSLQYISTLPISSVKIDKSFIDNIEFNEKEKKLNKLIVSISRELGLYVVAEGIENNEQFEILKNIGINFYQGYLLSKPLSLDKAKKIINKKRD